MHRMHGRRLGKEISGHRKTPTSVYTIVSLNRQGPRPSRRGAASVRVTNSRSNASDESPGVLGFALPNLLPASRERLVNLCDSLRGELRKEQVSINGIEVEGGHSPVVTLSDEGQRTKALAAIQRSTVR